MSSFGAILIRYLAIPCYQKNTTFVCKGSVFWGDMKIELHFGVICVSIVYVT